MLSKLNWSVDSPVSLTAEWLTSSAKASFVLSSDVSVSELFSLSASAVSSALSLTLSDEASVVVVVSGSFVDFSSSTETVVVSSALVDDVCDASSAVFL